MTSKSSKQAPVSFDILSGLGQELHAPLKTLAKSSSDLINTYKQRDFEYLSYKDFKNIISTLEVMRRQLERCAQTTQGMIDLHQIKNRIHAANVDLNAVVGEVLGLLNQQFKASKINVIVKYASNIPKPEIGDVECRQVVYNILLNAVQAMPAGGKLKVTTSWDKNSRSVVLTVEDEGVGIPPEYLNKVFEPFFTTKERGLEKNSGLGLSIVHAIVTSANGHVVIKSSLRRGTVVRVELPVSFRSKS